MASAPSDPPPIEPRVPSDRNHWRLGGGRIDTVIDRGGCRARPPRSPGHRLWHASEQIAQPSTLV